MNSIKKIQNIILIDPAIPSQDYGAIGPGFREGMEQIGIRYIAASLLKNGYYVEIIEQENQTADEICSLVKEKKADLVGLSIFTAAYGNAVKIAKSVKEELHLPIIAGGVHITTDYVNLSSFIDIGIVGEGEYTTIAVLDKLNNNEPISSIKGIVYHCDNQIIYTGPCDRIKNLDDIVFPVRNIDRLKMHEGQLPRPYNANGCASLFGSRGCVGKCTFCTNEKVWDSRYVARSVDNIINEMCELSAKGINYFWFGDENFTQDKRKVLKFTQEIIKKQANGALNKVYWVVMGRVDSLDDEMLVAMKESGCVQICYGIETADENLLKLYKKDILLDRAKAIIDKTNRAGIMTTAYFIIGTINESEHTLNQTKQFILEQLNVVRLRIGFVYPFPGTELREQVDTANAWIDEEHKNYAYATGEVPVIKCQVSKDYLIKFQTEVTDEYYHSERYEHVISQIVLTDPDMKKTLEIWKLRL